MKLPEPVTNKSTTVNLLLYGEPGAGKTSLAASLGTTNLGPVLFLNAEGGRVSLVGYEGVDVLDVESLDQLEKVLFALGEAQTNATSPWAKYKTVVLDSVTELQNADLEEETQRQLGTKGGPKDQDDLTLSVYGKNTARLRRVLRWYRDLPLNVVFTALTKEVYSPGVRVKTLEAPKYVGPALTRSVAESLAGYVDFVWLVKPNKDGSRLLLFSPSGPYLAKTRNQRVVDFLEARTPEGNPYVDLPLGDPLLVEVLDLLQSL